MKFVLSIDVGIINLGYVFAELDTSIVVKQCNKVDITKMRHRTVSYCNCKLHHDFCIPDYIDHFIQEHYYLFEQADIILIERQPPVGITNVQDLLFSKFRDKVKLISPNAVHKFFKMDKDYETRKIESNTIGLEYLTHFENYHNYERKHDISDALLLVLYYFKTLPPPKKPNIIVDDFEQFRFIKA